MVVRERADAARNRRAILDAASALFEAATDPLAVTMDDIAASAGVGKGTLFRRFGDRAGLVRAVYATRFGALYEAITSGPPPLGPGVPAHERALAVLDAIVSVKLDNRRIALVLESLGPEAESTSLFDSANYRTAHTLLAELAAEL
ncbi:TetR/AcrR family transcriptional regulator, partial [Actinosynnema sp.]